MCDLSVSLVLAAEDPFSLAKFYAKAFLGNLSSGQSQSHWIISRPDGFRLDIYRPSRFKDKEKKGNALAICMKSAPSKDPIKTLDELVLRLESIGGITIGHESIENFGVEKWVIDPEGNSFLVIVPSTLDPNF